MKVGAMFPGRYLKAADLGGEDVTYTIESCEVEMVGNGDDAEDKPVLRFKECQQALVLNKTNTVTIAEMYGDNDTDSWIGQPITLYPTRTQMGAKMVDCIRVRLKEAKRETPVFADEGSKNEPF